MVKLSEIRLCVSAISQKVHIGKVSKDGNKFEDEKKDITSDFIKAIIDKFADTTAVIGAKGEQQYNIYVEKTEVK